MTKISCGALLYTYSPKGELGIILGLEKSNWLPFKGCNEKNETYEQTAIREIYEETSGLLKLDTISLRHEFRTKHKEYKIGLCYAEYSIIDNFKKRDKSKLSNCYKEKEKLRFFKLTNILKNPNIHVITKESIKYYWADLNLINLLKISLIPSPTCV